MASHTPNTRRSNSSLSQQLAHDDSAPLTAENLDIFAPYENETRTPQTDISSSDPESQQPKSKTSRARAKKQRKSSHQNQTSIPSLRPAKDILSRIRHDPALRDSDYIVGYLDRHLPDPVEMDVSDWKGGAVDVTEEDWIPQHRILYFRKKGDIEGRKVWDREKRIDRLFGSGIQEEGEAAKNETIAIEPEVLSGDKT